MGQINIDLDPVLRLPGEIEKLVKSAKDLVVSVWEKIPTAIESLKETVERFTKR